MQLTQISLETIEVVLQTLSNERDPTAFYSVKTRELRAFLLAEVDTLAGTGDANDSHDDPRGLRVNVERRNQQFRHKSQFPRWMKRNLEQQRVYKDKSNLTGVETASVWHFRGGEKANSLVERF